MREESRDDEYMNNLRNRAQQIRLLYENAEMISTCAENGYNDKVFVLFDKKHMDDFDRAVNEFESIYKFRLHNCFEDYGNYIGVWLPKQVEYVNTKGEHQATIKTGEVDLLLRLGECGHIVYVQSKDLDELEKKLPYALARADVARTSPRMN